MAFLVLNQTKWEWFKLRRRWMPWVLVAIALLFSQLAVWGPFFAYQQQKRNGVAELSRFGYGATAADGTNLRYEISCQDVMAGNLPGLPPGLTEADLAGFKENCRQLMQQREQSLLATARAFTLPGSIAEALRVAQGFGVILIAIMTASLVGTEYGWGTLRTSLLRGPGRGAFLAGKLALMLAGGLVLTGAVALAGIASGAAAGALAGTGSSFFGAGFLGNLALDIGKAWFSLWPFVALAALFSTLARSSAAGMAGAIGYYFAEVIASGIFMELFDWARKVGDYLLVRNASAWMQDLRLSPADGGAQMGLVLSFRSNPSALHAFLVLAAYTLALSALAFWVFKRRDVTAGGGG